MLKKLLGIDDDRFGSKKRRGIMSLDEAKRSYEEKSNFFIQ